jgi:hypothetical protein
MNKWDRGEERAQETLRSKPLEKKKRMRSSPSHASSLLSQVENVANNVATVTACDGAPVAVTLATGTQGGALDAPVVEFDCVVSGPGAVEEAGTRSPLSANFGECGRGRVGSEAGHTGRACE